MAFVTGFLSEAPTPLGGTKAHRVARFRHACHSTDPRMAASKLASIKRRGSDVSAATTAPGDKVVRAR
jgi:hypothetical protein